MDEDEASTIIAVILISTLGLLIGFYTGVLSFAAILVGVCAVAAGYISWSLWKAQMVEKVKEVVDHRQSDSLAESGGLDNVWEDLQDWLQQHPRNMEIVWTRQHSHVQTLPAKSLDEEIYVFTSIVTKLDGVDKKIQICVENTTGYIVAFQPIHYKEQVKRDPFQYVSFVQELRRHQFTSDEVVSTMRRNSAGQLPGGYVTGMPIDQNMVPQRPEASEPTVDEDNTDR